MAFAQAKDAAPIERMRKKPRLSLSSSSTTSATTATSTTTAAGSKPKSGLLPPSVNASRLHYAFGSRMPISGKENTAQNTLKTSTTSYRNGDAVVKKVDKDATAPAGSASAMKQRQKRRRSVAPPVPTAQTPAAKPKPTAASDAKGTADGTPQSRKDAQEAVSTPASTKSDAESKENAADSTETTPPASKTPTAELSPAKRIEFEPISATDPAFWKARQEYVRKAMLELQALERRLTDLVK